MISTIFKGFLYFGVLVSASNPTTDEQIRLRDLALPRFFGTAANTTFLFNDQNYTEVAKSQVFSLGQFGAATHQ